MTKDELTEKLNELIEGLRDLPDDADIVNADIGWNGSLSVHLSKGVGCVPGYLAIEVSDDPALSKRPYVVTGGLNGIIITQHLTGNEIVEGRGFW